MALTWKPAIYKEMSLTQLPRPVVSLSAAASWDFRESKVPLSNGATTDGHSSNGTEIVLQGKLGHDGAGENLITDLTMMAAISGMQTLLHVQDDADKYEFFAYHASGGPYYKWKPCCTREFSWDIGDDEHVIFPYSITMYCENTTIRTTAPGLD